MNWFSISPDSAQDAPGAREPKEIVSVGRRAECLALTLLLTSAAFGAGLDGDRGKEVLRDENCLSCHSVQGEGGKTAPDLGRRLAYTYTPATLASVVWNHMPQMWPAMAAAGIPRPRLSERDAESLFAYLYSLHFFDSPGDAARGKRLFDTKNCDGCHALGSNPPGPGKAVASWKPVTDPLSLVQEMWNHSAAMKSAFAKRQRPFLRLSGQELADLTAFVRSFESSVSKDWSALALPDPGAGKPLFDANCRSCHSQILPLEKRLSNRTLLDIAAALWNHLPRMLAIPMTEPAEMRGIISYVWQIQYMGSRGSAARGGRTFEQKGCASCHNDAATGASKMARGERVYTPFSMIALGWDHGQPMEKEMSQKGIPWPRLAAEEISDLTAYINSRP